ncbi:PqqD family protein [Mesorhizobium sp. 10J20-29]
MMQPSRGVISAATKLVLAPKVSAKSLGENEGGVLLKLDSGEMFTVNDTTMTVLGALEDGIDFGELVSRLSDVFDVDREVLESDLVEIAQDLLEQQLIRRA